MCTWKGECINFGNAEGESDAENGWSQNVDFTDVEDSVLWAPFLKDSRYQSENLEFMREPARMLKGYIVLLKIV